MDAAGSVVDSLVIREGRVAFAGRRGDINPAPGEPTLDLGGRAVLPGLVDGHGHLMLLARARLELNLAAAGSEDEIARREPPARPARLIPAASGDPLARRPPRGGRRDQARDLVLRAGRG